MSILQLNFINDHLQVWLKTPYTKSEVNAWKLDVLEDISNIYQSVVTASVLNWT